MSVYTHYRAHLYVYTHYLPMFCCLVDETEFHPTSRLDMTMAVDWALRTMELTTLCTSDSFSLKIVLGF